MKRTTKITEITKKLPSPVLRDLGALGGSIPFFLCALAALREASFCPTPPHRHRNIFNANPKLTTSHPNITGNCHVIPASPVP